MDTIETTRHQLDCMERVVQSWLDWQKQDRAKSGAPLDGDSVFLCMDMPAHPPRRMFESWAETIRSARAQLER